MTRYPCETNNHESCYGPGCTCEHWKHNVVSPEQEEEMMNDIDELLASIDALATKLEEQATLLNDNLRSLQGNVATLMYRLKDIYRVTEEREVH